MLREARTKAEQLLSDAMAKADSMVNEARTRAEIMLSDARAKADATDHTAAWTAALRAARTALLTGDLDTIAVTIGEDHCGALYSPARDEHGRIDPTALTASLVELHQAATAGEIAHLLADQPTT